VIRQFELVERVRDYNPNTDEALLNRASVSLSQRLRLAPLGRTDPLHPEKPWVGPPNEKLIWVNGPFARTN